MSVCSLHTPSHETEQDGWSFAACCETSVKQDPKISRNKTLEIGLLDLVQPLLRVRVGLLDEVPDLVHVRL